jgi:RNA polymerase sigma-70 factor (ECF subfamily)
MDAEFAAHRDYLFGLCYRMTGSAAEAEDLVQSTFERALTHPPEDTVRAWLPWLVRVATNLSIDALRKRRRRAYVGPWLPGFVETPPGEALEPAAPASDVELRYAARESLSYAFMIALEALTPVQRATLLLRDAFGYTGPETAQMLGISPENVRITLHRARKRVAAADPEAVRASAAQDDARMQTLMRLMAAAAADDAKAMMTWLAEDVKLQSDGGGEFAAALKPLHGRDHVARFLEGLGKKTKMVAAAVRTLNGGPVLLVTSTSTVAKASDHTALRVDLDADGRIREIHIVVAPKKLHGLAFPGSSTPSHSS